MNPRSTALHIVLVDKDPGEIRLLEEASRRTASNNHFIAFNNAESAWSHLHEPSGTGPNIILLNDDPPAIPGLELLQRIKGDKTLRSIPVILLSKTADQSRISEAYSLHANCYVIKRSDSDEHMTALLDLMQFWGRFAELPITPQLQHVTGE